MLGDKTLLQYIIDDEIEEFANRNKITYSSIDNPLDLDDGSIIFEVNSASTAFQKFTTNSFKERVAAYASTDTINYMKQLGKKIIKLDLNSNLSHALNVAYETYKQLPDVFAGVLLLTTSGAIINPLHPLAALELLKEKETLTVSKLLIFTYKDLSVINSKYNQVSEELKTKFKEDISTLIQVYQSQIKSRAIKIINNEASEDKKRITQRYKIGKYKNEDDTKEYFIVAHQLLTEGTFVPYYGTSLISMNGTTSGFHLSPFKSCNINNHRNLNAARVCTGSSSNKTIKGLRTLHHANLNSPYEFSCMSEQSKSYADECINYSFKIFKQAKLIEKE